MTPATATAKIAIFRLSELVLDPVAKEKTAKLVNGSKITRYKTKSSKRCSNTNFDRPGKAPRVFIESVQF